MNAVVIVMMLALALGLVSAALGYAAGRRCALCPSCRRVHRTSGC